MDNTNKRKGPHKIARIVPRGGQTSGLRFGKSNILSPDRGKLRELQTIKIYRKRTIIEKIDTWTKINNIIRKKQIK